MKSSNTEFQSDFSVLRGAGKHRGDFFWRFELATKTDLRELEYRLVIKLGAMMMASIAAVAALVKLL